MKYFIGFKDGAWPAGNAGLMSCPWQKRNSIVKHANMFAKTYKLDDVFLIDSPQKLCEVKHGEIRKYLLTHAEKIWDKQSHMEYMAEAYRRNLSVARRGTICGK